MSISSLRRCLLGFMILALFVGVPVARAQQTPPPVVPQPAQQQAEDTVRRGISPRSAFIRSLIIPGWGQYSVGAKKRAGVFFVLQSTSYFMLAKTLNKLGKAQDVEVERVGFVTDSLRAKMAVDSAFNDSLSVETVFQRRVDTDSLVTDIRALVESRKQQRQDWIAYTLFTTLASGADAYIAAHLADFPGTITTQPRPDGSTELKFTMPVRRRR